MDIKELKQSISSEMIVIPSFIDTTSSLHHLVWDNMLNISSELLKLITDTILMEKTIFRICNNINNMLDTMIEITPNELQMKIIAYYSRMIIWLQEITIDEERYEAASNVRNFINIYYNVNPIK
jgi:hypothetical protein